MILPIERMDSVEDAGVLCDTIILFYYGVFMARFDEMGEGRESFVKNPLRESGWIWMPLFIFIFGVVAILLVYMMNNIRHSQRRDAQLISSLMEIEMESSLFHLFLEEYIVGDLEVEPKQIFLHIEDAIQLSESILRGDEKEYGRIYDPGDRVVAMSLKERVSYLKTMGIVRLNDKTASGPLSYIDHEFDIYFDKTIAVNRELVSRLKLSSEAYANKADTFFRVIIGLLVVIIFSTIAAFIRIRKRQVEANSEVRASEQEFRMLFNAFSDAVFLCNEDYVLDCNPYALELFGAATESQLVRKSLLELAPEIQDDEWGSRVLLFDNITRAFKEGRSNFEFKFHRFDGSDFYADVSLTSIKIRRRELLQAVVRDVTERKKMLVDLERLATTDTLTKAFNRAKFNELIVIEMERAKRFHHALSLLMFDLDHFKDVNDTYGHTVGDEVLIESSDVVRLHMRRINHFIRWGGEEFIVIAVETDLNGSVQLAERIRQEIELHEFEKVGSITLSFGVTQLKANDTAETFIKRVDDALYMAKEGGRNMVKFL
jgi:diguanylate cyclase (GGDEF)-like protein/PAS domain S-box-containing protein